MAIPLWPHGAPIDSIWITKTPLNLKCLRQRPTEACLTTSTHAPGRFWRRLVRMTRGKITWEIVSMLNFTMGDWMFTTGWSLFSCLWGCSAHLRWSSQKLDHRHITQLASGGLVFGCRVLKETDVLWLVWNFSPVTFNSRPVLLFLLFFWLGCFSCFTFLSSPLGPRSVCFSSFHGSLVGILSWNSPLVDELVRTWTFQHCRKLSHELVFVLKASALRVSI